MYFIESIIVNVLHPVVYDRPRKDVTDVCKGVQYFYQITSTGRFCVLLYFFSKQFDAQLNQLVRAESRRLKFWDFKGIIELEQGSDDGVHSLCFASRLKNLHQRLQKDLFSRLFPNHVATFGGMPVVPVIVKVPICPILTVIEPVSGWKVFPPLHE